MSIQHLKAAFNCREFTGTTRLLLIYLADAASNGKPRNDGKKNLPPGYTSRSILAMMRGVNTNRPQTVTAALKELRDAGAIKTFRRKQKTALNFVDIKYLEGHAYTDDDDRKREEANPQLTPDHNAKRTDLTTTRDVTETPLKENNAKRTGKTTQSAQSCGGLTTESVVKNNAKRTANPLYPTLLRNEDQNHPTPSGELPTPLRGGEERGVASQRKPKTKTKPVTQPVTPVFEPECLACDRPVDHCRCEPVVKPVAPPVTRKPKPVPKPIPVPPEPSPLTPEDTCAECGGFYLDCNHKSGTVAKPVPHLAVKESVIQ